jgi:catechol 2,3-dioxygenase-like lactoylglutathione lyase family enzyme
MHPLDHLVLAVPHLDEAAHLFERLGFQVQAKEHHHTGTANRTIIFDNQTYLELLSIQDREVHEKAVIEDTGASRFLDSFLFRRQRGLAMIGLKTDAISESHARLSQQGFVCGPVLEFSRSQAMPQGDPVTLTASIAYAQDHRAPDFSGFVIQGSGEALWHEARFKHHNQAQGLNGVILCESNPSDFQYFLSALADTRSFRASSFGLEIPLGNALLQALTPQALALHYGINRSYAERGLQGCGLILSVPDCDVLADQLEEKGFHPFQKDTKLILDLQDSLGVFIVFEKAMNE